MSCTWVITNTALFTLFLNLLQFWPLRVLFRYPCVLRSCRHASSSLSGNRRCLKHILPFPCPTLKPVVSSRSPGSFGWRMVFRNEDLGQPQWLSGLALPAARGMILESQDRIPRQASCMESASSSACGSASLSLCVCLSE